MHQASALQIATLAWVFTCVVGGRRYGDDEPMAMFIGKRVLGLFISISVLVCMYKCCCGGDDSDTKPPEDAEQPPAEESNQLHTPNKPTVPSYNTCPPNPSSYQSPGFSNVAVHMMVSGPKDTVTVPYPTSPARSPGPRSPAPRSPARSPGPHNVTGASSPFRQNPVPVASYGITAPTPRSPRNVIGASSPFRQGPGLGDDTPRFEPKELQNVQLPLNSDSPSCSVYTSAKLNF